VELLKLLIDCGGLILELDDVLWLYFGG